MVEGKGNPRAIKARIEEIKVEIEKSTSDYDKKKRSAWPSSPRAWRSSAWALTPRLSGSKRSTVWRKKVVRGALENAASIAAMILTTDALVTDTPENGHAPAMAGGNGMGGMGDF